MRRKSYWMYSVGCGVVWAVVLAVSAAGATAYRFHNLLLIFAGWVIAWISGTIARYLYPPPKRWLGRNQRR